MTANVFLKTQVIPSIDKLIKDNPFVAFTIMAISIEFLGKGRNTKYEWGEEKGTSLGAFKKGIELFPEEYKSYQQEYDLYHSLRCSFAHCAIQKANIILHRKGKHLKEGSQLHLSCEQFFADFKYAVNQLVDSRKYSSKMEKVFFTVSTDEQGEPSTSSTIDNQIYIK